MKKIFSISILMVCIQIAVAQTVSQKIDTIYYDSNYKGVPVKAFASYMTIVYMSNDTQYSNIEKTFYITGELQGEFTPVSIDKSDLNKSKFKGNYITYYRSGGKSSEGFYNDYSKQHGLRKNYYENGKIKDIANFNNGFPDGESQQFYENGNISAKANYINGEINGTLKQYFEDGGNAYIETEMFAGKPKYDFITYVDANDNRTKYDKDFLNIIQENPSPSDRKSTISNGRNYFYYQMNGIFIAVDINAVNEIDKFWEVSLVIGNNSKKPFTFETNQIICYLEDADKVKSLKVYTSNEFSALVGKRIRRKSLWNALGENLATMNAGTTTSTASGYVNSAGVAIDNQGYAAAGISSSYGSASNQTYSGAAQYQANQTARQNINQYNDKLQQYKQALDEGYLQSNTINPGESITGNINAKYIFKKGSELILKIPVNGTTYSFSWKLNK